MKGLYRRLIAGDRWIPTLIVLFFVALTALEARFITLAVGSFNGLVTDRAYPVGMPEAEVARLTDEQRVRGWQLQVSYPAHAQQIAPLQLTFADSSGQPVTGLALHVVAERVTRHGQAVLAEPKERAPGRYEAPMRLPLGGDWTLRIVVKRGAVTEYRLVPLDVPGSGT